MKSITKVQKTGGSLRTSIPSSIVKLYDIEVGDHMEWSLQISENGKTIITIEHLDNKEK